MIVFVDAQLGCYEIELIYQQMSMRVSTDYEHNARESDLVKESNRSIRHPLRGPWKAIDEVEYATLEWVDWFNSRRLLESIGDMPPARFKKQYYV